MCVFVQRYKHVSMCIYLIKFIFSENKPGPSGMGGLGIISQLLLCKSLQPDFQQEEICSIEKDLDDICAILKEMQDYMPQVGYKSNQIFICNTCYIPIPINLYNKVIVSVYFLYWIQWS